MFTAIFTFLASVGGRLLLGKIFDFVDKWQDSKNQLALLKLQGDLDAAKAVQNSQLLELQAKLGIQNLQAQAEVHVAAADDDAFVAAVRGVSESHTGIAWVDAWNGVIRPFLATVAIAMWLYAILQSHGVLNDWDRQLMSMVLGIFIGGRIHATGR